MAKAKMREDAEEKSGSDEGPLAIQLPKSRDSSSSPPRPRGWISTVTMSLGVVFSICLAKLYIDQYIEIRALTKRRDRAEAELADTRKRYEAITEEVEYLETLEGVERLARDKLRYIRPDEVILVPLRPDGNGE
jgi:cell division protein FtsB